MPFVANEWMQAAIWRSTSLSSSLLPVSFVLWMAGYWLLVTGITWPDWPMQWETILEELWPLLTVT